mgnify:CR=1 FL=1
MRLSGDPVADFLRKDAEDAKYLNSRPRCCECGEYIQDEKYYDFHDRYICPQCLEENHRKWTDDFE